MYGKGWEETHFVLPSPIRNPPAASTRIVSIDVLRGIVMVLMAIDHARVYFTNAHFDPLALDRTWPALFVTRWITHFCAPVFLFLAGTSAFLSAKRNLSRFLLARGLWLVLLEVTIIDMLWLFDGEWMQAGAGVIWAIGWSMIALAALVKLPVRVVGMFGLAMIALHNLLDPLVPSQLGPAAWLWTVLHEGGPLPLGPFFVFVAYPLVPWIGVMAAGYAFGSLIAASEHRARLFARTGAIATIAFIVLRALNVYGDPVAWSRQPSMLYTLFSFVDTHKYPPSLAYLLMTLGPALLLLAWLERTQVRGPLVVFGRVPFFYYLLHLGLLHAMAVALQAARGRDVGWMLGTPPGPSVYFPPADYGYGLPVVYLTWAIAVAALYWPCRWFAEVKARRRDAWLSYL
ncbi:MAG TPA: heparan-alpha-glucosaminide N-acetyltransferase domain-containing protein [Thermoanaerobaculia bacterium]